MTGEGIEPGRCRCGCGERPSLAAKNETARKLVKGEPRQFVRGHSNRTPEARARLSAFAGTRPRTLRERRFLPWGEA